MRIADMNWMQVETYLASDNRCVLPIGSTEQHAGLSLCVDAILAERVSVEAAEPLGVPVYPVMPFGCAPYFAAFPGSISLKVETLLSVVRDVIYSLYTSGFRRILIVSGHGGNAPVGNLCRELMSERPHMSLKFHQWWNAPRVVEKAVDIAPHGAHANWFENFPWTRLEGVTLPTGEKPIVPRDQLMVAAPQMVRELLDDGSFGGLYQVSDEEMRGLWEVGVAETRSLLDRGWPNQY
jgi:creatinine amidohydrolase